MKKNLLSVLAASALLFAATSCSEDQELLTGGNGNSEKVSFQIEMDGNGPASRSIGDGKSVTTIYYEVWDKDAEKLLEQYDSTTPVEELGEGKVGANISFELVKGVSYDILFWAQSESSAFDPTDLKNVTMKSGLDANQESYDAFAAAEIGYKVQNTPKTVTLTRPFAQVNVGTSKYDWDKAKELGVEINKSKVVIKKELYTKYDVSTGYAKGRVEEITYQLKEVLSSDNTFTVSDNTYHYLGMNYVLAAKNRKSMHNMDIELYDGDKLINTIEVTNMPIQRNHRTNVIGNLLTSNEAFEVVIDASFVADDKYGVLDGETYIRVKDADEFYAAFNAINEETGEHVYDMIILESDIALNQSASRSAVDPTLTISSGKALTIDLNGHKLSATSTQTGKNYNMFDVRGALTIKDGTIEYKHNGENMEWNNYVEIFYVGFNGTLNLDGVNAKNLGGSDMAYVIDMVNATNITVNVENSTLKSTYIPVRVFNNSETGVNDVTIQNSTLDGKYCFWVQYWLADGRDQETLEKTLNLDIYNGTNTFVYTGKAPVLYGDNEYVYLDTYGEESAFVATQNELNVALKKDARINLKEGQYSLTDYPAGVTLIGAGKDVSIDVKDKAFGVNGNVTIENVKLIFSNDNYKGFQHTNVEKYKNCVIVGQPFLYGNDVTFENCTFEQTSADAYNVWTYGAKNVKFVNCVFNSAGKSVLIYHESQGQKVSFEGCTLNASTSVSGKAAIEIDSSLLNGDNNTYEVIINNTTADGFDEGNVSGNSLWNQKKGSKATITVDGEEVAKVAYSSVGNAEKLTEALTNGENVILSTDVKSEAATTAPYGNKYAFKLDGGVIDGGGHELHMECYGDDYGIMTSGGTVKNLTIKEGCRAIMIMYPQSDVILDNVNIGGDGVLYPINTGEAGAEGVNLIVTNSTLAGWTSFSNIESASFTNVKFEQGTYYNNIYGRVLKPYVNTTLTDCSFVEHMNLDLSGLTSGHKVTIKNCTVNGQKVAADVFTIPSSDAEYDTALFTVDLPSWATDITDCIVFE